MEMHISGRHFQVTEALKEHISEKVQKLDKFSLKIETIHVVLEVQKFHHICEITLSAKQLRLTAKEESADMYSAFDMALANAQLQLNRKHDKVKDHKGRRYTVSEE